MKRIACITVVAIVALAATCFEYGNPLLQPTPVLSQVGRDLLIGQHTFSIAPTQTARFTVANLSSERKAQPITFRCLLFDQNGSVVFESASVEVPVGGFRHVNILSSDAAASIDSGLWRSDLLISNFQVGDPPKVVGSLELIDPTGKTVVYIPVDSLTSTR